MSSIEFLFFYSTRFIYHDPQNRHSRSWQRHLMSPKNHPSTKSRPNIFIICAFVFENVWVIKSSLISPYTAYVYIFWGFKESSYAHFHILCIFRLVGWVKIKRRRRRLRGLRRLSARPKTLFFFV